MNWLRRNTGMMTGLILGSLGGFLYWYYVGCDSGQCMIISQWYNSTMYGALIGGFTGNALVKSQTQAKDDSHNS